MSKRARLQKAYIRYLKRMHENAKKAYKDCPGVYEAYAELFPIEKKDKNGRLLSNTTKQ